MRRLLILAVLAVLFSAATVAAQTAAQARVIRPAVIVDQPRGDASVVTTIPPGVVIGLLARNGDWYEASLVTGATGTKRSAGWINQGLVELLPNQPPVTVVTGASSVQTPAQSVGAQNGVALATAPQA